MKRVAIVFLAVALTVGVLVAPAIAGETCWGENDRACLGTDLSGNAYIRLENNQDFGVIIWMNPQITSAPAVAALGNTQLLLFTHTTAVDTGNPSAYVIDLSIHGVRLSYTHECTNNPTSCG
ncbi:hypothetical protein LCGC14_1959820 [marine sediment metagenome]|uniref:Uncharacterized protein n=1 Tax=marine sediment metagenome TaxID=412755 RepID=A0A0F9FEW6_9ZZZZ